MNPRRVQTAAMASRLREAVGMPWQVSASASTRCRHNRAFTLIEVMVAMLLFFLAVFSILQLVSMCLHNARLLQRPTVNTASVAAWLSVTNRLSDEPLAGDFQDILGEQYKNFEWRAEPHELTNGLFVVPFGIIEHNDKGASASAMTTLMFMPGSAGAARGARR